MSTPTIDSALRMHKALLVASRLVTRAASSVAYYTLAESHPRTARDLMDLTTELDRLGYIDPLPERRHIAPPRRNTLRLQTAEDDDDAE